MPRPAVIVTGASGFVGRHLLDELKTDYRIFAIARRSQRECGAPVDPNIAWMRVDVGDEEDLARTFREIASAGGAKHLIHLAAYYDFTGDPHPAYHRTNIQGTQNVLRMARQAQVSRLTFASSVAACGFPRPEGPVTESTPPDGPHVYAWSKREGERLVREFEDVPSCIVRFGAVFSDWCEYPPLYRFLQSWLGRPPWSRILPGSGQMAIPYIHVRDAVRFLRHLIDVHDRLDRAETVIASTPGATSLGDLYGLATRHYQGSARKPVCVPAPLCAVGLRLGEIGGAIVGRKPFERTWMARYLERRLEIDNSRTCSRLGWSPVSRFHIEKRFPFLMEHRRSEPLEWRARNEAAMRREAGRPGLELYKALIAFEDQVLDLMAGRVRAPEAEKSFPRFRALPETEFLWLARLLYRLLLTSIQTSNRMLLLNYFEVTCPDRFRAGFTAEEVNRLLEVLGDTLLASLRGGTQLEGLERLFHEQIQVPLDFGREEVRDQYDHFLEGSSAQGMESGARESRLPTDREMLEETIWRCLVQRK